MGDHEFIVKFIGADISEISKRNTPKFVFISTADNLEHSKTKVFVFSKEK